MHKEWTRTAAFTDPPDGVRRRFVSDYDEDGAYREAYWQHEVEVPDVDDEPTVDGLYEDQNNERWIRLSDQWLYQDDNFWDWQSWADVVENASTPFMLVPPGVY